MQAAFHQGLEAKPVQGKGSASPAGVTGSRGKDEGLGNTWAMPQELVQSLLPAGNRSWGMFSL